MTGSLNPHPPSLSHQRLDKDFWAERGEMGEGKRLVRGKNKKSLDLGGYWAGPLIWAMPQVGSQRKLEL